MIKKYIYGVKLGVWHKSVKNGTKTENLWKMLLSILNLYIQPRVTIFIPLWKLGEWINNVIYEVWLKNATKKINTEYNLVWPNILFMAFNLKGDNFMHMAWQGCPFRFPYGGGTTVWWGDWHVIHDKSGRRQN